jgi:excisionase family DNA binding protein
VNILTTPPAPVPPLALRAREAAHALSISQRKLSQLVARGEIASVRVDRVRLFPVDSLRAWLSSRSEGGAA